jgi:hypothetical protein
VTATAALDLDGRQVKAEWQWRLWIEALPFRWTAMGNVVGPTPPSQEDGLAMMSWGLPPFAAKSKLRVELTTNPHRRYWWGSGFATDYLRGGDTRGLNLAWSDLVAMSRGASSLHVALRKPDGTLVYEVGVDPKTFVQAASEVQTVLGYLTNAKNDYKNRCQKVDDIDPQIIVT